MVHGDSKKESRRIGMALVLGLIVGLGLHFSGFGEFGLYLNPIGIAFVKFLKMVIIPLVFSSIFMSIINLGHPDTLGTVGRNAIIYYFCTTAFAVFLGIIFVNLINPGVGADLGNAGLGALSDSMAERVSSQQGLFRTVMKVLMDGIPSNPFGAMADASILPVIVFALLMGLVGLYYPQDSKGVVDFLRSLEKMSLGLTHGIMKFAPVGVFVLMVDVLAKTGFAAMISLSKYILTVLLGLACHFFFLTLLGSVRLKKSPFFLLRGVGPALMTAFSTSSSAATLPITMANVEENLGVKKETAKFVLPLGATINMDGTALYESVAAIFIAQAYGIHLGIEQQVVIFLTASLAAVGAAAIPGAGLITMSIVLGAVGLPLEGIGLILAVDRVLDMFRTTVNVFGDCIGTVVVDSLLERKASGKS